MAGGGVTLGYLRYVLGFDSLAFEKGASAADARLKGMERDFARTGKKIGDLGKSLSVGISAPIAGIAALGLKEAQETQAAMAQVTASLASMGPVAGRTAAQLRDAADAFEGKSLFEADEILRDVTANMLTFGNISGQVFDRAQQAAIDLATKLKKGPREAAIMVGKALNDPVRGVTALGEAGVQFDAKQRTLIKSLVETGQTAKAQTIILGELEKEYRGSGAAAQLADPLNAARDAMKSMAETIGLALIPILPVIAEAVKTVAGAFAGLSPETQKFLIITAGVSAAVGPALIVFGSLTSAVGTLLPLLMKVGPAWTALSTALAAARVAALATLPALVPFLVPLAGIAAAVTAVTLAWRHWDTIGPIVGRMVGAVKSWLVDKLGATFDWLKGKLKAVGDWFFTLYDRVVGHSYVPDMVAEIGAEMQKLEALMVQPAAAATGKAAEAFRALQGEVGQLLGRLFPEIERFNRMLADSARLSAAAQAGILSAGQAAAAQGRLQDEYFQGTAGSGAGGDPRGPSEDVVAMGPLGDFTVDLDPVIADMGTLIDTSREWKGVLADVARDVAGMLGDSLARMVEGSMRLKDLWRDLLAYVLRFATSPNGLSSLLAGARASGGPVVRGSAYLVGERGPEIFTPSASGRILSNRASRQSGTSGGGGMVNHFNIRTPDVDGFRRSEGQIVRQMSRRLARAG